MRLWHASLCAAFESDGPVLGFLSEATPGPEFKFLIGPYILTVFGLNITLTLLTGEECDVHIAEYLG